MISLTFFPTYLFGCWSKVPRLSITPYEAVRVELESFTKQ